MAKNVRSMKDGLAQLVRIGIFSFFIFHFSFLAQAQLRSEGDVPADLKMNAVQLYESDLQRAKEYTGGKVKDRQKLQSASYSISKMMAGGRIVYGDPVSKMVSRIADTLLVEYPELRSQLRFYTVKSPEVNAFATGQGMVFVNAGLVAQVENEAQLAFVLSHEIIHYYRNHSMEELVGKKDKERDADKERAALDEFLRHHNRSHEMENEADSLGVAMFYLKSPYSKDVTEGIFDVLQYSALPFDDVPFDTNYFNTKYYKLTGCWLDSVADITSRDNYDDSRSDHPNILTRRHKMAQVFDGYYGGEDYVVTTREEFEAIRRQARLECVRQELIGGEYSRAFYNAWLMEREDAGRKTSDETVEEYLAHALYGVAMFKNHNGTNSVTGDYNKIEGESQQVYYALRRMSNEQATVAALHRIWQLHRLYPDNKHLAEMADDLMAELRTSLRLANSDFLSEPPKTETAADTVAEEAQPTKSMTKYERIKQKRHGQTQKSPTGYSLTDLMVSDSEFEKELRDHLQAKTVVDTTKDSVAQGGVFIHNSSYWVVNDNTDELKVAKSQRSEIDLAEMIVKTGKRFDRQTVDFSDNGLHQMSLDEEYNDFVVLNEWMNEFWQNKGQFSLHRLTQPGMDSLIEHYGASTVELSTVLNVENMRRPTELVAAFILAPFIPVFVYDIAKRQENTVMVNMVVDAAKGKVLSRQVYLMEEADDKANVEAMVYDSYHRAMKGKPAVGPMGRRFMLMGGVQLGMPGLQPISKIATITPWASAEFALNNKYSLSVSWSHIGAFDEYNTETRDVWVFNRWGYYDHQEQRTYTNLDYSKAMTTWSFTVRKYTDGFAPLGTNVGYGAHMVHFTNPSNGSSGGNSYGLHISAGRNYMFFERLMLNIEARYGYTFGFINYQLSDSSVEKKYKMDALLHNAIQLRIGIGIMPF